MVFRAVIIESSETIELVIESAKLRNSVEISGANNSARKLMDSLAGPSGFSDLLKSTEAIGTGINDKLRRSLEHTALLARNVDQSLSNMHIVINQSMITVRYHRLKRMSPTPHNLPQIVPASSRHLALVGASAHQLPKIFLRSEHGSKRFWEFFTVNIRNPNTARVLTVAAGWVNVIVKKSETTRDKDWWWAMPPELVTDDLLAVRRDKLERGRAERYLWGGPEGESVRGQLTSKFRRAVQG